MMTLTSSKKHDRFEKTTSGRGLNYPQITERDLSMFLNRFVILVIVVLLFSCASTRPVTPKRGTIIDGQWQLDEKIAELGANLLQGQSTDKKLKMVVIPFSDLEHHVSEFGKYVSEGLIGHLAKTGKYVIVERELLYKILEEQKLGMLGIIDDNSAKKVGKILGVDCVVTGTFSVLESRVKINARVIETETGLIMSAAEASILRNTELEMLLNQTGKPVGAIATGTGGRWAKTEVLTTTTQPSPPYGKDYYAERNARLREHAVPVNVTLRDGHFVPVVFGVAANWNECPIHLVSEKPRAIKREPAYQGSSRKYGFIRLGNTDNNIFYFALDLTAGPHPLLYLDRNQNGDLTDDGGPITNQGDKAGVFSSEITLPFDRILKGAAFPEGYKAWLFTNETYWERDIMCIYSKSQLKGKIVLDGIEYLAYIADSGINDATYTNKGIYVDINRNGKIESKSEFIEPEGVAEINSKWYEFKITW